MTFISEKLRNMSPTPTSAISSDAITVDDKETHKIQEAFVVVLSVNDVYDMYPDQEGHGGTPYNVIHGLKSSAFLSVSTL
jgi:hypothetical protein